MILFIFTVDHFGPFPAEFAIWGAIEYFQQDQFSI